MTQLSTAVSQMNQLVGTLSVTLNAVQQQLIERTGLLNAALSDANLKINSLQEAMMGILELQQQLEAAQEAISALQTALADLTARVTALEDANSSA
jgi:chromosome segregation ATPase